jgi:hypothetical protein
MSGLAGLPSRDRWSVAIGGLATLVASVVVAGVLGFGLGTDRPTLVVGCLVALGVVLCVVKPYLAGILLITLSFAVQWAISLSLLPASAKIAEDGVAFALTAAMALMLVRRRQAVNWPKVSVWVLALFVAALCSVIIGRQSATLAVLSLRTIWRFVPLLFAPSLLGWTDARRRRLVWLLVALCVVQAPIVVAQLLAYGNASGDPMGGTLGGGASGAVTTLVIGMATLLTAFYIYRAASRPLLLVALAALCLPPALNETKAFFVAAPVILGVMLLLRLNRNTTAVLLLVALSAVGLLVVAQSYGALYGHGRTASDLSFLALRTDLKAGRAKGGELTRMGSISYAVTRMKEDPIAIPFGFGAGSLVISQVAGSFGSLIEQTGAMLRNPVFIVRLVLEYGLIALFCFAGVMVSLYRTGLYVEKAASAPFWRAAAMGLQGFVITMVLLSVYTGTFTTDSLAATFWTLAGVTVAEGSLIARRRGARGGEREGIMA